jgi:alkylation response protein AidB-like acyl-CoA dehydrogenase
MPSNFSNLKSAIGSVITLVYPISNLSQALGIASGAYELSLKYSRERKAFGTEISNHQAIAFKLADMATRIEAARLLCMRAAFDKDQHKDYTLSSSMAKVYASETAMWAAVEAVQFMEAMVM